MVTATLSSSTLSSSTLSSTLSPTLSPAAPVGTPAHASATPAVVPARRRLRSFGAVAGGLVAIFAVTTAVDLVMHAMGVFPAAGAPPMSGALFLLAFSYRFVIDVAGSYLTARLAPSRPLRHALVLGAIGLGLSVLGAIVMWNAGPAWYALGLAASALPCAWLGARLQGRAATRLNAKRTF